MMDHPSIAKVFDAGTTPDGQPYFVMEYVRDVPLTDYCNEKKLRPRWTLQKPQLIDSQIQQFLRAAETGGVLLRSVLGLQVGMHFGAPASRATFQYVRMM